MDNTYTEGIAGDGAAILKNGIQITITEILETLNSIDRGIFVTPYINCVNELSIGSFNVIHDNKLAEGLTYDETLGLLSALLMPQNRPCLFWLKTPEQIQSEKERHEKAMEAKKDRQDIIQDIYYEEDEF